MDEEMHIICEQVLDLNDVEIMRLIQEGYTGIDDLMLASFDTVNRVAQMKLRSAQKDRLIAF